MSLAPGVDEARSDLVLSGSSSNARSVRHRFDDDPFLLFVREPPAPFDRRHDFDPPHPHSPCLEYHDSPYDHRKDDRRGQHGDEWGIRLSVDGGSLTEKVKATKERSLKADSLREKALAEAAPFKDGYDPKKIISAGNGKYIIKAAENQTGNIFVDEQDQVIEYQKSMHSPIPLLAKDALAIWNAEMR